MAMTDIVERLRMWPAAEGKDALAGHFVEALVQEAALEIERLREALQKCCGVALGCRDGDLPAARIHKIVLEALNVPAQEVEG